MASVRGAAPRLVAGSGSDCVTTYQDWDTTYVGTSPDQLPWPKRWKEKWSIYYERKKEIATPKNTSKSKKKGSGLLLLLLLLLLYTFLFNGQRHQTKRKIKEKEKKESGSRPLLAGYGLGTGIRAPLARILIPDPDSNPLLRIRVRCGLKARTFLDFLRTFCRLFTDFPDSIFTWKIC
jgi:hypothetical protein